MLAQKYTPSPENVELRKFWIEKVGG